MDEKELLQKRFSELSAKAYNSGIFLFSDFLGLSEQSAFYEIEPKIRANGYTVYGGAEGCERVMIRFGCEESAGYTLPFPITVIKAEPVSQKFADRLTHRDLLGALMNLGIERDVLGDIVLRNNVAYIFAKDDIADFIISELCRAKHTDLSLSRIDALPEGDLYKTERRRVQVTSPRADALIARVFSLSREDAQTLFNKKLVFIGGAVCTSPDKKLREGDKVSARGYGRFIYLGEAGTTKKGRLNIEIDVYI